MVAVRTAPRSRRRLTAAALVVCLAAGAGLLLALRLGLGARAGARAAAGARGPVRGPPAFYRAMIPHHRGAILMARRLLAGDPRPELATLARSIATGQSIEIDRMRRFWRAWARRTGGPGPAA
jgi:DUF305 family protein family protein